MFKSKNYLHLIPSLRYGGAESFLLRLVDNLDGNHLVVVLMDSIHDELRIKQLKNHKVKYLNLNFKKLTYKKIKTLFDYITLLNKDDRIFSWLYIMDLLAIFIKVIFRIRAPLIWNVRNTLFTNSKWYISCKRCWNSISSCKWLLKVK